MRIPKIGEMVEINVDTWIPFLVTHVLDAEIVSGVAFNGKFRRMKWSRCAMAYENARLGEGHGDWRRRSGSDRSG